MASFILGLVLAPTLPFSFLKKSFERRCLAGAGFEKSSNFRDSAHGHRGQHQPARFFCPRRGGPFVEAVLLPQLGWNYDLALGADDRLEASHELDLTIKQDDISISYYVVLRCFFPIDEATPQQLE